MTTFTMSGIIVGIILFIEAYLLVRCLHDNGI